MKFFKSTDGKNVEVIFGNLVCRRLGVANEVLERGLETSTAIFLVVPKRLQEDTSGGIEFRISDAVALVASRKIKDTPRSFCLLVGVDDVEYIERTKVEGVELDRRKQYEISEVCEWFADGVGRLHERDFTVVTSDLERSSGFGEKFQIW